MQDWRVNANFLHVKMTIDNWTFSNWYVCKKTCDKFAKIYRRTYPCISQLVATLSTLLNSNFTIHSGIQTLSQNISTSLGCTMCTFKRLVLEAILIILMELNVWHWMQTKVFNSKEDSKWNGKGLFRILLCEFYQTPLFFQFSLCLIHYNSRKPFGWEICSHSWFRQHLF